MECHGCRKGLPQAVWNKSCHEAQSSHHTCTHIYIYICIYILCMYEFICASRTVAGVAPEEAPRHPRARDAVALVFARVASVRGLGGDPKTLGWLPKRPRGTPGHGVPWLLVANLYSLSYLVRLILSVLSSLSYRLCLALSVSSGPSYRRCPTCRRLSYQGGDPKTLG